MKDLSLHSKEQEKMAAENRNFILQCTRSILDIIKISFLFTIVNHFFFVFSVFFLHFIWQFLALMPGWRGQLPRYILLFFFPARSLPRTLILLPKNLFLVLHQNVHSYFTVFRLQSSSGPIFSSADT